MTEQTQPATDSADWSIEDAERTYGVSSWGGGYFSIGQNGNVHVLPHPATPDLHIDFDAVISEIKESNISFPVVVRFHDILRSQVITLNQTFRDVIDEAGYASVYRGVYPIKVNQMREVVEEIMDAGKPYHFGLEAGSKPELLAVLAYNTDPEALTILNGYKDEEFMRLALLGRKLGRKIVVVIEQYSELVMLVRLSKALDIEPIIGLRAKLQVRSEGRWKSSAGERAKFGLTVAEIIKATQFLKQHQMQNCLQLIHFHIGSQLPDIRSVKEAVNESARIYADLIKMGFGLKYLDVGGGLGIDYDGSKSKNDSSRNYSLREYVADVVYGIKEVCDLKSVPHPTIVSESGRAITAHHSCVITEVVGAIKPDEAQIDTSVSQGDHILLKNISELYHTLGQQTNMQEVFNDAVQWKEEARYAFKLSVVSLEELGKIEAIYWKIMRYVYHYYRTQEFVPAEVQALDFSLSSQYLCNFSVFQSAVDSWAIGQILPVVPLTGLDKVPEEYCSLVDITCDSDGKIDKFIIDYEASKIMPMQRIDEDTPLYLGLFLTGAYQDVMGDMHNLFGRLNEVHIFSHDDDPEDFYIEEIIHGSSIEQVLAVMQYHPKSMALDVKKLIDKEVTDGNMKPREGVQWTDFYEDCMQSYTYLKTQ